ncbi:MAG: dihydrofolate reductase family protein [Burkholderiaceae bacterium]
MRKLILSMMVSADQYIARPDGDIGWFRTDADFEQEALALLESVDCMFFGRKSYQLLAQYWPMAGTAQSPATADDFTSKASEERFATLLNTIPKRVYSRTLSDASWGPVTIAREVDNDEIDRLKCAPGKDLVLFAGASLATAFAARDLFDEYRLMIHPILLDKGIRLFGDLGGERPLSLVRTRAFASGVTLLVLARDRVK